MQVKASNMKIKIISVVGARPNFMKIAPIIKEFDKKYDKSVENILVHTGQHYSTNMSDDFFRDLKLPEPDINLNVGSSGQAKQIANIMLKLEKILLDKNPQLVIVVGDVNSTLAAALTASKLKIKVAHIEAGLRSFDFDMPEETNRILTDHISDYLFCTEESAIKNLRNESVNQENTFLVGNVMIDTLIKNLGYAKNSGILDKLNLKGDYCLLTAHRPENVDNEKNLRLLVEIINEVQKIITIIYPIHPRTVKMLEKFKLYKEIIAMKNVKICKPLSYLDFLWLTKNSKFVITDSGGLQEETSYLKIPCLTIRKNTERPITVEQGTNTVTGLDKKNIIAEAKKILGGKYKHGHGIALWDGKASERIVKILLDKLK